MALLFLRDYREGYWFYRHQTASAHPLYEGRSLAPEHVATLKKVRSSSEYLAEHLHEVPVLLVPCIWGRGAVNCRASRGLGIDFACRVEFYAGGSSAWVRNSLDHGASLLEQEAAQVLGLPYEHVMQAALIPVAYTLGTDFKPAARIPMESILHWDRW